MGLNPWAAVLLTISWGAIIATTIWCFYRMLTEDSRREK